MTKAKTKTEEIAPYVKTYSRISAAQANEMFVKSYGKKNNVDTSNVEKFAGIMGYICQGYGSFSMSDVYYVAKPFLLEKLEVDSLFERWKKIFMDLNKLEVCLGAYDYEIYILH